MLLISSDHINYHKRKAINIGIGIILITLVFAVVHNQDRLFIETFSNKIIFNNYLCLISVILVSNNLKTGSALVKCIIALFILCATGFSFYSNARSALIIYFFLIVFTLYNNFSLKTKALRFILPAFIGLFIFIAIVDKKASTEGRLFILKNALKLSGDNFFQGVGFNKFQSVYNQEQARYFYHSKGTGREKFLAGNVYVCNNELIQMLVELGFPVTALILLLVILTLYYLKCFTLRKEYLPNQLLYFSIFFFCIISSPLRVPVFLISIFTFTGYFSDDFTKQIPDSYSHIVKFTLLIIVPISITYMLISGYGRFKILEKWKLVDENNIMVFERAPFYDQIYPDLYWNRFFLLNYITVLNENQKYPQSLAVINKLLEIRTNTTLILRKAHIQENLYNYKAALDDMQLAINIAPNRFLSKYELLKLYLKLKDTTKAQVIAREIADQKVKILSDTIRAIKDSSNILLNRTN
ncbi:O-antigen ligase family protein [Mucilaginibacter lappiensis]